MPATPSAKRAALNTATARLREQIWQWVHAIPPGKVASYGQLARLAGYPSHARFVGATLKNLPRDSTLPWHRVLHNSGKLAFPPGTGHFRKQQALLAKEGVLLTQSGKVAMKDKQWQP